MVSEVAERDNALIVKLSGPGSGQMWMTRFLVRDPAGCSHWSVEPDEVEETPLAKRVRVDHADDCITIDSDSASSEDEPIAFLQHDFNSH